MSVWIDGQERASESAESMDIRDPRTGEVGYRVPISGPADVDAAFAAARSAFGAWRRTTPARRQDLLLALRTAMLASKEELLNAEERDTGKPRHLLEGTEFPDIISHLTFMAGAARTLDGFAAAEYLEDHLAYLKREPLGVVAQITPWNYPLMMAVWKLAPALAAGNTVVLKPSDTTPGSTLVLARLASEIFPAGVVNVVTGDASTGRLLSTHPEADMVAITGSVGAGRQVATAAAQDLRKVHLELGGKAPALVFADVDIDSAVAGIAEGAFFNAGQDCTAVTRIIVHRSIRERFVNALTAHIEANVRTGIEHGDAETYGPLNSSVHRERVAAHISRLPDHARILTGGHALDGPGYHFAPTLIDGVEQGDEIVQQEVFGPVATIQTFHTDSEAIDLANGTPYGLAASVWTTDHSRALRVTGELDFGVVWVNTHMRIVAEMPHGGFKHTGGGKDLSRYGFEDYTRIKYVMSHIAPSSTEKEED